MWSTLVEEHNGLGWLLKVGTKVKDQPPTKLTERPIHTHAHRAIRTNVPSLQNGTARGSLIIVSGFALNPHTSTLTPAMRKYVPEAIR